MMGWSVLKLLLPRRGVTSGDAAAASSSPDLETGLTFYHGFDDYLVADHPHILRVAASDGDTHSPDVAGALMGLHFLGAGRRAATDAGALRAPSLGRHAASEQGHGEGPARELPGGPFTCHRRPRERPAARRGAQRAGATTSPVSPPPSMNSGLTPTCASARRRIQGRAATCRTASTGAPSRRRILLPRDFVKPWRLALPLTRPRMRMARWVCSPCMSPR